MKLILASNNKNKLREFRSLMEPFGAEVLSQREAGFELDVDETGVTFEENAYIKAKALLDASGCVSFADDSGLTVDALNGEPGVYSARYGPGHDASDADRYNYLLSKLDGVSDRSAKFVCCICCLFPDGREIRTRGEMHGTILHAPRGENGFGYDPVFQPDGTDRSNAELSAEEKNAISHRGKALREFVRIFEEYNR